jgi:hypothetical protein
VAYIFSSEKPIVEKTTIVKHGVISMDQMKSIHPRTWLGGEKKNTSMPRSSAKLHRALKGIDGHMKNHPSDGMNRQRKATIEKILSEM